MKSGVIVPLVMGILFWPTLSTGEETTSAVRYRFVHTSMSIDLTLLAYATSETEARTAAEAAFARIDELDNILSDYRPESELRRLCDTAGGSRFVPVSPDLWNVLRRSAEISALTDGAFDVTAAPAIRLWRRSRTSMALPLPDRMERALKLVGWRKMTFDEPTRSIRLETRGMRLDVGGIAKGYIVAEALKTLSRHGVNSALLAAGGDVGVSDPPPGCSGWILGVAPLTRAQGMNHVRAIPPDTRSEDLFPKGETPEAGGSVDGNSVDTDSVGDSGNIVPPSSVPEERPLHYVIVSNCFAATSGDAFQSVVINGVRYSHILDPRSGRAITTSYSVSLIGPDAVATDALATTMNVLGPEAGVELLNRYHGTLSPEHRIAAHFLWVASGESAGVSSAHPEIHHLHNDVWESLSFFDPDQSPLPPAVPGSEPHPGNEPPQKSPVERPFSQGLTNRESPESGGEDRVIGSFPASSESVGYVELVTDSRDDKVDQIANGSVISVEPW